MAALTRSEKSRQLLMRPDKSDIAAGFTVSSLMRTILSWLAGHAKGCNHPSSAHWLSNSRTASLTCATTEAVRKR